VERRSPIAVNSAVAISPYIADDFFFAYAAAPSEESVPARSCHWQTNDIFWNDQMHRKRSACLLASAWNHTSGTLSPSNLNERSGVQQYDVTCLTLIHLFKSESEKLPGEDRQIQPSNILDVSFRSGFFLFLYNYCHFFHLPPLCRTKCGYLA